MRPRFLLCHRTCNSEAHQRIVGGASSEHGQKFPHIQTTDETECESIIHASTRGYDRIHGDNNLQDASNYQLDALQVTTHCLKPATHDGIRFYVRIE